MLRFAYLAYRGKGTVKFKLSLQFLIKRGKLIFAKLTEYLCEIGCIFFL